MAMWQLLIGLTLIAAVSAQISFSQTSVIIDQGDTSPYIFVQASYVPSATNQAVTITLQEVDLGLGEGANNLAFNGQGSVTGTFDHYTQFFSFRVSSNNNGTFQAKWTINDPDNVFGLTQLTPFNVIVTKRTIMIDAVPNPGPYLGQYSEPIKVYLREPAASTLTLTLNDDNAGYLFNNTVQINQKTITIPAGNMSTSFSYMAPYTADITAPIQVSWSVNGDTNGFYVNTLSVYLSFNFQTRTIQFPTFPATTGAGYTANDYLYVYTPQLANGTVTVRPQAADTIFNPSSLSFSAGAGQVQRFQYYTTSPQANKPIYWEVDQGDGSVTYYQSAGSSSMNVGLRTVTVTMPQSNNFVLFNRSYMSIAIPYPTNNDITVTFSAPQLTFSVPSVTFSKNTTSYVVQFQPMNIGTDSISFSITGTDAAWYNPISSVTYSVGNAMFVGPDSWYIPKLYVGETSPQIPVRCSISPINTVTLTPSAPNLQFTPASMTFRNGTEQWYFTITPLYTSALTNPQNPAPITVNWLVSGADYTFFTPPPTFAVNVGRRVIQTHWSPHLTNTISGRSTTRHLGKTYPVWITANYVGAKDVVTVTPTSPYFSFSPAVLNFNSGTTRILVQATVTGVSANARIDYLIGGDQGGWYAPIRSETYATSLRPLAIEAAVLAPDSRLPHKQAGLVDTSVGFNTNLLTGYHVISFKVRSYVLPDGGLTITPNCAHATFSPSSRIMGSRDATKIVDDQAGLYWQLDPNFVEANRRGNVTYTFNNTGLYLEANFSVNPQAGGVHLVTFALSGKDADYYQRPPDQFMYFGVVTRDSDEPVQNAAGATLPSIAVVVVAIICAMFL